jgi:hypothetical protein
MKVQFLPQGIHPPTKSPLFISELASFEELERAELTAKPLTLFIAGDSRALSVNEIGRIAEKFLDQGLRYLCAWGPDCQRLHDIFDEVVVGDGTEPYDFEIMTTRHEDDSFDEALWFFMNSANVDEEVPGAVSFAIRIGNPPKSVPLAEAIPRIEEFQSD